MDGKGRQYAFSKAEKLCSRKEIDSLFAGGRSLSSGCLRLIYRAGETAGEVPLSILIAVPKKHIRRAVGRNRVKRLVREAYRLNSQDIKQEIAASGLSYSLAFIYQCREVPDFEAVTAAIIDLLRRFKVAQGLQQAGSASANENEVK